MSRGIVGRWALLLAAALLLLPLAGCWDRKELNELGIISATGIDLTEEGKWKISYQLVIPSAISSQNGFTSTTESPVNVFSTEGDSVRGAVSRATQEMSRSLYFGHNQVVVIGERAARKGIGGLLDVYLRNGNSRETVMVFVTEGEARPILEQLLPMERISGTALTKLIALEKESGGNFRPQTVYSMLLQLLGPLHASAAPGIAISGSGEGVRNVDANKNTSTPSKVRLQKLALFRDDHMIGWIRTHESRGLLWLRSEVSGTTISFPCREGGPKVNSARITGLKTKMKPSRSGDGWLLQANVEADATLFEYTCGGNLHDPAAVAGIERLLGQQVRSDIEDGLKASQRLKADVAGIGEAVRRKYPRTWKGIASEWNGRLYPEMKAEIRVDVGLIKTGRSNRSYEQASEDSRERK
ncbi:MULTISPECIES: Ger(x)C family spore germination protein [unclassified Paenibacillus]|uniref:Ger(x)C family spore germination protein n=1 Tax=unclassified Paenibacillus TaxID=185978 RepID=UPI0009565F2E|nr:MULTISPECIES: Ger(x)C family spore germination protein [unclassified Paenibacillus]ASS65782.2 Ger(x)C family spore germination protein [Paenibacillus sp. RUD330]SIQ23934.1 spore germination protein KC [Paenibacillus sp. RU4X]SIQ45661.1 spore germination protein KC [Paenibacillus sp. RU4T]